VGKRSTEEIMQILEKEVKAAKPWPMIVSQTKELKHLLKYTRKLEKKLSKLEKEN
jgi:hypothetical protein